MSKIKETLKKARDAHNKNVPAEISADRRQLLRTIIQNVQPFLDLNDHELLESIRLLNNINNDQPENVITLRENKEKTRGFYLDAEGVYCILRVATDTTRVEPNRKYRAFLNEEIIDDFGFMNPKWCPPEEVRNIINNVIDDIDRQLAAFVGEAPQPVKNNQVPQNIQPVVTAPPKAPTTKLTDQSKSVEASVKINNQPVKFILEF